MKMLTSAKIVVNLILWLIALGGAYGVLRLGVAWCEPDSQVPFVAASVSVVVLYFGLRPFVMNGVVRGFTMPGKSAWRK